VTIHDLGAAADPRPFVGTVIPVPTDLASRFRAMACDISLRVVQPAAHAPAAVDRAQLVFERVERACTRFDPTSPLMRANAAPDRWHRVPSELYHAVAEAASAHIETDGLFDPRVLRVLEAYGYDRTLPFARGDVTTAGRPRGAAAPAMPGTQPWRPGLAAQSWSVRIGPLPIDLGGIGKGLAVRWAAAELDGAGSSFLVEAGGDCMCGGAGPDGDGWKIGVEDPRGSTEPVAVLSVTDLACATSSVRVRSWRSGTDDVHHLIDPRTGRPGGPGMLAVTVVGPDPARAEVWSKSLFLAGVDVVAELATAHRLAALWVTRDGTLHTSPAMDRLCVWRYDRAL
jgi:FAD:protein FMN transferase